MILTASCMRVVSRTASAFAQAELFHMILLANLRLEQSSGRRAPMDDE